MTHADDCETCRILRGPLPFNPGRNRPHIAAFLARAQDDRALQTLDYLNRPQHRATA